MQAQVAYEDGAYRVYLTTDGITRRYVGESHAKPKQAIRAAKRLEVEQIR